MTGAVGVMCKKSDIGTDNKDTETIILFVSVI